MGKTSLCLARNPCFLCSLCHSERALTGTEAGERPPHFSLVLVCLGWPGQGTGPSAVTQLGRTTCCVGVAAFWVTTVTRAEGPKGSENSSEPGQGQCQRESLYLQKERVGPQERSAATGGPSHLDPKLLGLSQEPQGHKKETKWTCQEEI